MTEQAPCSQGLYSTLDGANLEWLVSCYIDGDTKAQLQKQWKMPIVIAPELKLITDLWLEGGIATMWFNILSWTTLSLIRCNK